MKRPLTVIFFSLALACLSASADEAAPQPNPEGVRTPDFFHCIEQDGTGLLWGHTGVTPDGSPVGDPNRLYTFDGKEWIETPAPFPGAEKASPTSLIRIPDGAVVCRWNLPGDDVVLTRHLGSDVRLLARYQEKKPVSDDSAAPPVADKPEPVLFPDSKNRLWTTGSHLEIKRMGGAKEPVFSYTVKPEQLVDPQLLVPRDPGKGDSAFHFTEDGRGRIWAMMTNDALEGDKLRGVLVFDGDKVEQHEIKGIDPSASFGIVRRDAGHMLITGYVFDGIHGGLYEVDIETFEAKKLPMPDEKEAGDVTIFQRIGDDLFLVTGHDFEWVLWRWRDGKWEEVIRKISRSVFDAPDCHWIRVENGTVMSAFGSVWFLDDKGSPVELDWRNGFNFTDVQRIFRCKDGSYLATGDRISFHPTLALPPVPLPGARIIEIKRDRIYPGSRELVRDGDGNVWMAASDEKNTLKKWDGEHWKSYKFPKGVIMPRLHKIAPDTRGRIWLMPAINQAYHQTAFGYLDSRTEKWQTYPSIEAAFESEKERPLQFAVHDGTSFEPVYSADLKRFAFLDDMCGLAFFDGSRWHHWDYFTIIGSGYSDYLNQFRVPFFNKAGRPAVTFEKQTRELNEHGKWQHTKFDPDSSPRYLRSRYEKPEIQPPEGCVSEDAGAMAEDNLGIVWVPWKGQLYKCMPGTNVKVFGDKEPHPFVTQYSMQRSFTDRRGNVFLEATWGGRLDWFMLPAKQPLPKTRMGIEAAGEDAVKVSVLAQSSAKLKYRWRLDNEPWQTTEEPAFTYDTLANGPHVVSAYALDEKLELDAVPAVKKFEVRVNTNEQITNLIARLLDPVYAKRESAVKALARVGAAALPTLKAKREKVSAEQRWWIDSAMDEITNKTKREKIAAELEPEKNQENENAPPEPGPNPDSK